MRRFITLVVSIAALVALSAQPVLAAVDWIR